MTSRRQGQASLQHPRHHHHQPTRCPSSSRQPMLTTASNLANPNQFSTLVNVKLSPQPPPSWPYSDCLLCLRQVRPANDLHDHHLLCLLLWPEASYHHPLQNHPSSWSSRLWPPNRQSHRPSYLPQLRPPPWLSHRIYRPTASSYFCLRLNDFHGLGHKPPCRATRLSPCLTPEAAAATATSLCCRSSSSSSPRRCPSPPTCRTRSSSSHGWPVVASGGVGERSERTVEKEEDEGKMGIWGKY